MTCKCKYFFNLWFRITNRMAYYNGVLNSPCSSECAKAVAKQYVAVLEYQLKVVETILSELNCSGFTTGTRQTLKAGK